MSGRRLTISSLLCPDDEATEPTQPGATHAPHVHAPVVLSGPGVPPPEFKDPQPRDPFVPEPHRVGFRSRAYSDYDRGNHESIPPAFQLMHHRRQTPSPPDDPALAHSTLRKEYRGDVLGHPEVPGSYSRPVSREYEIPSSTSHHLPQATSRPSSSSRRSSDPSRLEYRLYEGSSYFSPPSSRHSQADYLTTPSTFDLPTPFPHTQPLSPQQHSPSQEVSSNTQRPSYSPALGLHHITNSPPIALGRMSQHPTHSPGLSYSSQSPRHPHSPSGLPLAGSPGQGSSTGLDSYRRSASFAQPEVSFATPRTPSVNAIVNTEPARSPMVGVGTRGTPGGLEGLAALAEVAVTEARRRVSGELPSPAEVREIARRSSMSPALSRSPVLNRAAPSLHQPSLSPVLQRSPMLPSPRDTRVNSLAVIPLGGGPSHDGEPPSKRRRRTGSSGAGPHAVPHGPHAPPAPKATSPINSLLRHPSSSALSVSHDGPGVTSPRQSPTRLVTPPPPLPAETSQATHTTKPTSISQLLSPEPPSRVNPTLDHLLSSQPHLPVQEDVLPESAAYPVAQTSASPDPVPISLKAAVETELVKPASSNRVRLDQDQGEPHVPSAPVELQDSPVPVQALPAEEEEVPVPAMAMEEEEDVPEPAMVEEEEEPPAETMLAMVQEPQPEQSPPSVPPIASDEVALPSPVQRSEDFPMPSAPVVSQDPQSLPMSKQLPEVQEESGQPATDASIASPSPIVDIQDIPMSLTTEVLSGSLGFVTVPQPSAPETEGARLSVADSVGREAGGASPTSSGAAKEEEHVLTVPELASVKHEISEPPYQAVHRLSDHNVHGQLRHSRDGHSRQDDPHEWLLEHFAGSPIRDSRRSSPAPEEPPQTPYLSDGSPPPTALQDSSRRPESPSTTRTKRPKKVPSPSRSPTPTALLEQELDEISPDRDDVDIPEAPRSPRSDADTDFGLEFDLAASAAPGRDLDPDVSMGNELDDELLSLVDDQPRHSHTHSHFHPHHASSVKLSHKPTTTTRHEKLVVTKDPVVRKSVGAAIPPPPPPPILSSGVSTSSTPHPAAADRVVPEFPSRSEKGRTGVPKVDGSSVGMKKQEPAPKPIPKAKETPREKSQEKSEETHERPQEVQEKPQEKPKPKPKPRPVPKSKAKAAGEKDSAAGSSGRLTPSGGSTVTKGKGKKSAAVNAAVAAVAAKRGVSVATGPSRSRSASEMPTPAEPKVKPPPPPQLEEEEASEEEVVDDKLYCICKTSYDEDKVMIACDRCDEWYHTQCLNINDLEVDLIDQFVCPPCVMANPNLPLKTTYKARCMAGLKHPRPSSPDACHKPARGAFSKFCSDECGIAYMQRRIEGWGGSQAVLWASVKDTKQREGVVVKVQVLGNPNEALYEEKRPSATVGHLIQEAHEVQQPTKSQRDRKIARLQAQLDKLSPKREEVKKDLEVIMWREKLLQLAIARADSLRNECGWDQRLCMDDEDYADYGRAVLESYEEGHGQPNGVDAMHVDGTLEAGEWWCRGVKKCPRHAGWQKLRASEFEFDRKAKEEAISVLTAKEREIRGQLEDAISLPDRKPVISVPPLQPLNGPQPNGVKAKPNGTSGKKGKQKN